MTSDPKPVPDLNTMQGPVDDDPLVFAQILDADELALRDLDRAMYNTRCAILAQGRRCMRPVEHLGLCDPDAVIDK